MNTPAVFIFKFVALLSLAHQLRYAPCLSADNEADLVRAMALSPVPVACNQNLGPVPWIPLRSKVTPLIPCCTSVTPLVSIYALQVILHVRVIVHVRHASVHFRQASRQSVGQCSDRHETRGLQTLTRGTFGSRGISLDSRSKRIHLL